MFFDVLFSIYAFFYLPYLLLTSRWYKGYECRLGLFPAQIKARLTSNTNIWIHAVSVGEVMAVVPLIADIQTKHPHYSIVLTVTTKTGYELAKSKLGQDIIVIPSPLDFRWTVASFVKWINPRIYIVAETELWPNLFDCLYKKNIPIAIINGRISDVSWGRYKMIKPLLQKTLKKVSLLCMQSDIHAQRIIELGALPDRVNVLGNIKFDALSLDPQMTAETSLPGQQPLWIAGSTHPGEEEIILKSFAKRKHFWSLVIAPRHIERSKQIINLIESQGLKAVRYSQQSLMVLDSQTVVVVDTIGHLQALYARASLVFVGKSLCVGGGHNIIEPAMYAKPIIIGPLMQNFRDITALFTAQSAVVQVKNAQEFETQVERLMNDEVLRRQLGEKALAVVRSNQGALKRTLKMIEKWL